jgi:TetR/AcrR family transcriptional regulator, tetracycline repressor protein
MTPRKANTPTLTREQIVSAAIAIVDRDGLDALSMRKLGVELGVGTMTLYHHVPDKSALYDLILDAIMREVDLSADDPSAPVGERVSLVAHELRRVMLAHPHAVVIAMSRSLRTATQLTPVEAMLQAMKDGGVSLLDAMQAVNVIGQYTMGVTMAYANHLSDSEYHDDGRENDFSDITPEQFPNIVYAFSHPEHFGSASWDNDFEAGLAALIKGLVTDRIA